MVVGYTTKYCHFCNQDTPHQGQTHNGLLVWVCLNPKHEVARMLAEKD